MLGIASPDAAHDDALMQAVLEAPGRAPGTHARLSVEAVDETMPGDLRLPALIITVSNVVALPEVETSLLLLR